MLKFAYFAHFVVECEKLLFVRRTAPRFFMAKNRKHRKIKKHYTVAVTSDYSVSKTKYYRSRINIFSFSIIVMVVVFLMAAGLTAYEFYEINQMESKLGVLRDTISKQEKIIDDLGAEKAELSARNQILNNTIAMTAQEEEKRLQEEAARHYPDGFPMTGSAVLTDLETILANMNSVSDDTTDSSENTEATKNEDSSLPVPTVNESDMLLVFQMSSTSDVVSSADGVVMEITSDNVFGNCVKIDHENGYVSVYRNSGAPKVSTGDVVVGGSILFVAGEDNNLLGYQICKDNVYIDPYTMMVIDG